MDDVEHRMHDRRSPRMARKLTQTGYPSHWKTYFWIHDIHTLLTQRLQHLTNITGKEEGWRQQHSQVRESAKKEAIVHWRSQWITWKVFFSLVFQTVFVSFSWKLNRTSTKTRTEGPRKRRVYDPKRDALSLKEQQGLWSMGSQSQRSGQSRTAPSSSIHKTSSRKAFPECFCVVSILQLASFLSEIIVLHCLMSWQMLFHVQLLYVSGSLLRQDRWTVIHPFCT